MSFATSDQIQSQSPHDLTMAFKTWKTHWQTDRFVVANIWRKVSEFVRDQAPPTASTSTGTLQLSLVNLSWKHVTKHSDRRSQIRASEAGGLNH